MVANSAPAPGMDAKAPTAGHSNARPSTPADNPRWPLTAGMRAAQVPDPAPSKKNTTVTATRWARGDETFASGSAKAADGVGESSASDRRSDTIDRQPCGCQSGGLGRRSVGHQPLEGVESAYVAEGHRAQLRAVRDGDDSPG